MQRTDIVDVVARYETALVLDALHRTGVLAAMRVPAPAVELAQQCGVDVTMLEPLLAFAAASCTLIERGADGSFGLSGAARELRFATHMLDQYVGGYGPALTALAMLLREGGTGAALVDLRRHAAAFTNNEPPDLLSEAAKIILDLGATGVVELGCGGGQTLCALAQASPTLRAIGIDANPEAVVVAAARIHAHGLSERVRVWSGEALDVLRQMPLDGVQVVLAASMLNALWRETDGVAVFVAALAQLLPGRLLVVSDYYSHLGVVGRGSARTLLHDVVQIVSGQGLPPPTCEGWDSAYRAGGATLLQALEASGDGIDRFVHLVRLPD
jgi:SAM-dependent methyltransferase